MVCGLRFEFLRQSSSVGDLHLAMYSDVAGGHAAFIFSFPRELCTVCSHIKSVFQRIQNVSFAMACMEALSGVDMRSLFALGSGRHCFLSFSFSRLLYIPWPSR